MQQYSTLLNYYGTLLPPSCFELDVGRKSIGPWVSFKLLPTCLCQEKCFEEMHWKSLSRAGEMRSTAVGAGLLFVSTMDTGVNSSASSSLPNLWFCFPVAQRKARGEEPSKGSLSPRHQQSCSYTPKSRFTKRHYFCRH